MILAEFKVKDADGHMTTFGPGKTSYAYLRGAWAETRDVVWDRDNVVLRFKDGKELLRVTGVGGPEPDAVITHHPGWLEYSSKIGSLTDRRELTAWAVACAQRVLPIFETTYSHDPRPRAALVGAMAFVRGEIRVEVVADLAALGSAAGAEAEEAACIAAARACASARRS